VAQEENLAARVTRIVEEVGQDKAVLSQRLKDINPLELAEVFQDLDEDVRDIVFEALAPASRALLLDETDPATRQAIIQESTPEELSELVGVMPPDEGADLIDLLPEQKERAVLDALEPPKATEIQGLLEYAPETAGGLMTTKFVVLKQNMTVGQAIESIQGQAEAEDIYHLYVVDDRGVLRGLVPMRRLITARQEALLSEIMKTEVISALTDLDQEEVARLVDIYNLAAIPVVDERGRLHGVVTVDDVIDVIREEASEDVYRMAGTRARHPTYENPGRRFIFRLPWLLILVAAGLINSLILRHFGHTLETITAVTFFIPVILAMAGNVSLQSSSIMVRGLATGEVIHQRFFKVLLGEFSTGLLIGLACGTFVAFGSLFLHVESAKLSMAVGIALFFSISVAAVMGTAMPLMFHRLGVDPAVASGPFVTTLNDIFGLLIYLSVSTALLI